MCMPPFKIHKNQETNHKTDLMCLLPISHYTGFPFPSLLFASLLTQIINNLGTNLSVHQIKNKQMEVGIDWSILGVL